MAAMQWCTKPSSIAELPVSLILTQSVRHRVPWQNTTCAAYCIRINTLLCKIVRAQGSRTLRLLRSAHAIHRLKVLSGLASFASQQPPRRAMTPSSAAQSDWKHCRVFLAPEQGLGREICLQPSSTEHDDSPYSSHMSFAALHCPSICMR